MSSITLKLEQQARLNIGPCNPSVSPSEYFRMAAQYLQQAGQAKKANDLSNAYLYLMSFFVLIQERLPSHPMINYPQFQQEYAFNLSKCNTVLATERETVKQLLEPKQQGFLSNWFGPSPTTPPRRELPPTPVRLPPTPVSPMSPTEQLQYRAMETVVMNDKVQESVGRGVANLATNEEVQGKVADGVANAARNRGYQQAIGKSIAESSDNALVKQMAQNEKVQGAVGQAFAQTVGNKEVQKKIGTAVATAATNKEVQKKVAQGFLGAARLGWKGAKAGAGLAVKGGTLAYSEYQRQQEEEANNQVAQE